MKQGDGAASSARDTELELALVEALARMGKPASAAELRKALPKPFQRPAAELTRLLDALAKARTIFVAAAGKTSRYTHQDPALRVEQAILTALGGGPLSRPELTKRVKQAAPGLEKAMGAALNALLKRGAVREHPKVGKLPLRYALDPPDPAPFLAKATKEIKAVLSKLAPHGVSLSSVYLALGRSLGIEGAAPAIEDKPEGDEGEVLAAVRALAAREPPGALLSVRAVRAMRPLEKARFDRAVLRLSEAGKVVLHHHDFPASLPAAERAELVEDSRGTHYIGIAPRRGA